jgi:hypothetical protein
METRKIKWEKPTVWEMSDLPSALGDCKGGSTPVKVGNWILCMGGGVTSGSGSNCGGGSNTTYHAHACNVGGDTTGGHCSTGYMGGV